MMNTYVVSRKKISMRNCGKSKYTNQTRSGMAEYCTLYSVLSDQAFMANYAKSIKFIQLSNLLQLHTHVHKQGQFGIT